MPFDIYVSEQPRTLAVVPQDDLSGRPRTMLVLEHKRASDAKASVTCSCTMVPVTRTTLSHYLVPLNAIPVIGILGLLYVGDELFLGVVTHAKLMGQVASSEKIYRVSAVRFYSLTKSIYDTIADYYSYNDGRTDPLQHPCDGLSKYLCSGAFYYSPTYDLTKNTAASLGAYNEVVLDTERADDHFFWNGHMLSRLLEYCKRNDSEAFDQLREQGLFLNLIQGYVGIAESWHDREWLKLALISRISCKRAGARFQTRGLDDDGNVANYVETELVVVTKDYLRCHIQIRGNVPAFWEQQGLQLTTHRVQIARSFAATKEALKRHLDHDLARYNHMYVLNLLSEITPGEATLSETFEQYLAQLGYDNITLKHFDFNYICRNGALANSQQLIGQIDPQIRHYGFYCYNLEKQIWEMRQDGIFRTNCMDCLDRTNVVQGLISHRTLELMLLDMPRWMERQWQLSAQQDEQWAENGDALSRVTPGKLVYQKQVIIYDPMSERIQMELQSRIHEGREHYNMAGTFNVNGREPNGKLREWININAHQPPDILVVAFQEVVSLTPQQVMSTNETNRYMWEELALDEANRQLTGGDVYINLRSGQLVGVALIVMVLKRQIKKVKQVEMAMKKTGLGGVSGNKGAVAIRLNYLDTGFCFVSGHFASGQTNYLERVGDYNTIDEYLLFTNGRHIQDHKNVFWLGDFNFRIDMVNEDVRYLIEQEHLNALLDQDQLLRLMSRDEIFQGFTEGQITFLPTYKYELGTDYYDMSEKQRIPAWTDRILYRGKRIKQLEYSRANLRISDHRPVRAIFSVEVSGIDAPALERSHVEPQILSNKQRSPPSDLISFNDTIIMSIWTMFDRVTQKIFGLQQWWDSVNIPPLHTLYRTHHDNPFDSETDSDEEQALQPLENPFRDS
ncbi:SacI homology domain-containing protein [Syncephalis plumigaleata]|nr:SacI homology domain-containing protein [Syncephalis plumigaleata]